MPTAVLKFGGEVVAARSSLAGVLRDVFALVKEGWRFALCHGGGPQASALQERLHIATAKVGGRRITDPETLQVMKFVLAGEVSVDVVAAAQVAGLSAVGISGVSTGLVSAVRRPPKIVSGGGPDPVDFGLVGEVHQIRTELIEQLWQGGYTPVINTLGLDVRPDDDGLSAPVYNINADTVACAVAGALRADHLFLMTGVPGVLRDKGDIATRIPHLDADSARRAIDEGLIVGGMIPKIEEALDNLVRGIGAVHILGAGLGSVLEEAKQPGSNGTVLVSRANDE